MANANDIHTRPMRLLTLLIVVSSFLLPSSAGAGILEGVVFSNRGPVPGSIVSAFPDYRSLVENSNPITSSPGEKEGQYRLALQPGLYYLTAHGKLEDRNLYSYHGINPITITDDYRWLPFFLVAESTPVCRSGAGQGISGLITYRDQPIDRGVVSVYNSQDGKFRGMGLLTNTIGQGGRFSFPLEPGSYVVIARRKQVELGIGPVMQGDLFCYPSGNPLTVEPEQLCEIAIECYPRDDLEAYLNEDGINPQGRRHEIRRQASLWDIEPETAQGTVISRPVILNGQVTDLTGTPVPDLVVTAYPDLGIDPFQMHILRLITENRGRTDSDGRYRIELPAGGRYYLQARQKVGEAPDRQEYYGLYEGNSNHSVQVNPGETLADIDITVSRIMPYSELGEQLQKRD